MASRASEPCSKCGADKQGYGHRTYCQTCWREYQRDYWIKRQASLPPRPKTVCDFCGTTFQQSQRRAGVRYCSPECHAKGRNVASAKRTLEQKQKFLADRACPQCGVPIPATERSDRKFCSRKCLHAAHQLKRKLRHDGYLRAQIAERDKWRCGICGKRIDPAARHPDPGFASIDHIVPRSRGGSHEPRNLRITHLRCNISRKATFDAGELSLSPRALHDLQQTLFDE